MCSDERGDGMERCKKLKNSIARYLVLMTKKSSEFLRDDIKICHGILEEIRVYVVESCKKVGKIRRFVVDD